MDLVEVRAMKEETPRKRPVGFPIPLLLAVLALRNRTVRPYLPHF